MFKYKKTILYFITFLYLLFSFIELLKYMMVNSNIYGLIYLLINLLIIFILIPTTYNYKRSFSKIRISKFIIVILLGIFNTYFLQMIVLNNINVIDSSKEYIDKIFVIKNIFKIIIYFILLIITVFEFKFKRIKSIRK